MGVFFLFSVRGLEFLSKSLQQWWVWKCSASFEMKRAGRFSVWTSLQKKLIETICCNTRHAIQHLAKKEALSSASVCYCRQLGGLKITPFIFFLSVLYLLMLLKLPSNLKDSLRFICVFFFNLLVREVYLAVNGGTHRDRAPPFHSLTH